ncbi:MAG: cytochrome b6-f complex iron-sulfur subunit [Acidimicrobiaceae bacterium]|jgi:cytochrome b6-f complex iron-sulfur subunit
MSNGAIIGIGVAVLVVLAVVLFAGVARRRDTGEATGALSRETRRRDKARAKGRDVALPSVDVVTGRDVEKGVALERSEPSQAVVKASSGALAPWVPPDPELIGVTRRKFLNRGIVTLMSFGLTAFGLAVIGFLWPSSTGGFGSKIRVGKLTDIKASIAQGKGFYYVPQGRMWITAYPEGSLEKARKVYAAPILTGMEAGVVALYQKCVHLGCRVPNCLTSQWFECPCHGSQYNRVGEKKGGPAPRGLDHFAMEVSGDSLIVNTGLIIQGPPIGTNTTGQEAEGPHCVGGKKE